MLSWYRAALDPVPHVSHRIPTRFGTTHVIEAGAGELPLVLLHGVNVNASVWIPQLVGLSNTHRVIAPDVPGYAGRSDPVDIPYEGSAYSDWLVDVLDGMDVSQAVVVGASAGGYFALKFAIYMPERVASVFLLNPCSVAPYRMVYRLSELPYFMPLFHTMSKRVASRTLARYVVERGMAPGHRVTEENVELAYLLMRYFRRRPPPPVLPNDDLDRVKAPVTLAVSRYEIYTHPAEVIARSRRHFAPQLQLRYASEAGHDINKEQPELVNGWLREATTQHLAQSDDARRIPARY